MIANDRGIDSLRIVARDVADEQAVAAAWRLVDWALRGALRSIADRRPRPVELLMVDDMPPRRCRAVSGLAALSCRVLP